MLAFSPVTPFLRSFSFYAFFVFMRDKAASAALSRLGLAD
jgi:hypothetical protein